MIEVDPRFREAIAAIDTLQKNPRYKAAFVYGSVALGTTDEHSDIDAYVITDADVSCRELNHPTIADVKFDIRFRSLHQVVETTQEEVAKGDRRPRLAVGKIIFDTTGDLTALQASVQEILPSKYGPEDYQAVQFTLHHTTEKARRFLSVDPATALYSMHTTISEVLQAHFRLQGQWWVGSKNVLRSLDDWDPEMATLVKSFVMAVEPAEKFDHWQAIVERIAVQMGGLQQTSEMNCTCPDCTIDLRALGHCALRNLLKDT